MDTRTGEVFETVDGELSPDAYRTRLDLERAEQRMADAERAGTLMPISARVAQLLADVERERAA